MRRSLVVVASALLMGLVAACAAPPATPTTAPTPAAPAAAPTTAPAPAATKPAEATKPAAAPAQPTATAAPKPAEPTKPAAQPTAAAAATKPAEPAKPATAGAKPGARTFVMVNESEPEFGLDPKDSCTGGSGPVQTAIFESLTYATPDGKFAGQLAESWERVNPTTWRFKLRQGVKFTNGEPFNADAVVAAVDHEATPGKEGRCWGEYNTMGHPAQKIDDYTVEIPTKGPDPIFPNKMQGFRITAPAYLKQSPESRATTAIGTGPFTLVEWVKGQHVTMKVNPDYWGPKPSIDEARIVFRKEPAVRVAMLEAGEADFAVRIPHDLIAKVPQPILNPGHEVVGFRINMEHAVLKDKRVRQAIAHSIDYDAIVKALYPTLGRSPQGHMIRPSALGFNPELKQHAYDPNRAKELVAQAGATGTKLDFAVRQGWFAQDVELAEVVANSINKTGLQVNLKLMETALWQQNLFAVGPGQPRTDLLLTSVSNPVYDSSRVIDAYYPCGSRLGHWCDEAVTAKIKTAAAAEGEERARLYREVWKDAHEAVAMVPLTHMDGFHGLTKRVTWKPLVAGVRIADLHLQ